ncbi:DUF1223 domain-containing protein [Hirschia litorea]|uniref:DUF1223 domain-containing protein n=1 Tax=Hirschia litorea TaxID=1199156 RepID=A0ABW2IME9_9PROT
MNIKRLLPLVFALAVSAFVSPSFAKAPSAQPNAKSPAPKTEKLLPFMELYTSQACPRCPKGNENFSNFAAKTDVVAITFPVDYWDFMGWHDTYAQKGFTKRQEVLNASLGRRGPYTPQVIFNGKEHCSAINDKTMSRKLEATSQKQTELSVAYDGRDLSIANNATALDIWLIEFEPGETFATPKSGQNANKTMVYHNRAKQISLAGQVSESGTYHVPCPSHCAIIFEEPDHGAVLGAITFPKTPALNTALN